MHTNVCNVLESNPRHLVGEYSHHYAKSVKHYGKNQISMLVNLPKSNIIRELSSVREVVM
jgi:hypothetical protein